MQDKTNNSSGSPLSPNLTPADFVALGVEDVAYVKPVVVNGARAYAIHADRKSVV